MARKNCSFRGMVCLGLIASVFLVSGMAGAAEKRPEAIFLTIFLKHDQSKTLGEIDAHLQKTGFGKKFPPAGTEVVSWYVMMGLGQMVTLKVPPDKLRAVNLAIERNAWGVFRTKFYPTYDFQPIWKSTYKKWGKTGGRVLIFSIFAADRKRHQGWPEIPEQEYLRSPPGIPQSGGGS